MKKICLILCLTGVFLCLSCKNSSQKPKFVFPEEDVLPIEEVEKLSVETIAEISKNITSPVEIANLLLMLDVPFSHDYLASDIDANKQSTSFSKALALGILGADLGYLNIYGKTGSSIEILSDIKKLSEDINVGQFFDFEIIKRLSLNKSDLDSLLYISIDSYTRIDDYLRENKKGYLSSLMIIGIWIEGLHLATQVVEKYPNDVLRDRIGEQKIILNDIILLASPYCDLSKDYSELCEKLREIKQIYDKVDITYSMGDPIVEEKDGGLVITQTETSSVDMTDEQLAAIIKITKKIRNKLIIL